MHQPATFLLLVLCVCALAASPAFGEDFPQRKSGLWEITSQPNMPNTKVPPHTVQLCIDQKTDNAVQQAANGAAKNMCSRNDLQRKGDRIVVDSVCKFGETTATTHSVFTGNFNSAYHVATDSTYVPPMAGISAGGATIEAKWLGPCKPGQIPGDMILSNGVKININNPPPPPPPRPPTKKE
jgi:Protein of unknown function (DUF3617)